MKSRLPKYLYRFWPLFALAIVVLPILGVLTCVAIVDVVREPDALPIEQPTDNAQFEPFSVPTMTNEESVCAGVGPNPLRVSLPDSTVRNVTPSPVGTFRDWELFWPYGTRATIVSCTPAVTLPDGTFGRNGDIAEKFCAGAEGTLYWPPPP